MLKSKAKKQEVKTIMNPDMFCSSVRKNPSKFSVQSRRACIGKVKPKEVKKKKKKVKKKAQKKKE